MTHQVTTRVREIPLADLPKVRELDGTERVANAQELLNMGLVATDEPNIYVSREQDRNDLDASGTYKPLSPLPGVVLAEGFSRREVYGRLPASVRAKVLRARVRRIVGGKEITLTIPMQAVRATDVIETQGIPPVAFAGERER